MSKRETVNMRKRLLDIGAVIALFIGVFLPAMLDGNLDPEITQEEQSVLLTEAEKERLVNNFVEKAEYTYSYYRWFDEEDLGFTDKGYCRNDLEVVLYWKDGVYYFIPLADCNGEVKSAMDLRKAGIDVVSGQCVFHKLWQKGGFGRDFGTWELYGDVRIPLDRVAKYAYLGVVEIDVAGNRPPGLPPLERNEYIEAAVDALKRDGDQGELPEGRYKIYIGFYEYSEDMGQVTMTGVMERNKLFGEEEYRWFQSAVVRNRGGNYDAKCASVIGADEKYPVMEVAAVDRVKHIVEAKRLVTYMEVDWDEAQQNVEKEDTKEVGEEINDWQEDAERAEIGQDDAENMRPQITLEEAKKRMEELCSYYQWFYVDMPYEIENLLEEGETYRIYTDGEGNGDIFWLKKDGAGKRSGQDCYGGICRPDVQKDGMNLPVYHARMGIFYRQQSQLQEIGVITWHRPDFRKPELPPLTVDGYIQAVSDYVQEGLLPKGECGKYQMVIGRYEIISDDVRAISAAVTGAEEYYLHCVVTRYADRTYGCFAAGGSYAGEWESGQRKVERILELERLRISFMDEETE